MTQIKKNSMFRSEICSVYCYVFIPKRIPKKCRFSESEFGMTQNLGIFGIWNLEFHPISSLIHNLLLLE